MKTHTSDFKTKIAEFGRELDSKITYTISGNTTELGTENLNSVSPHYEGAILKSVMKQLDIDSNTEIPVGTELNYQFGVKVRNATVLDYRDNYDYVNYGNYIVKEIEKQEDTNSWKITCYDKMLYAMKDYENTNIVFPITIRDYINAICTKCGLTFEDSNKQFANYDKVISNELYLDNEGNSLGYTFRGVLDELAQVTGGTICINANDNVEIRYIHDAGEITSVSGSSIYLTDSKESKLSAFEIEGKTTQASTPTPSSPSELVSVGYENLLEPITSINGTDIAIANGTVEVEGDTFKLTRTGSADLYFGQVVATGNTYTAYAGVLIDVSNVSAVYYYVSNPLFTKNIITKYDANKVSLGYTGLNASEGIFSIPNGTKYISFRFGYADAVLGTTYDIKAMICASPQALPYIPYGKYGIEIINTGKNIFNIGNFGTVVNNDMTISSNNNSSITVNGTATATRNFWFNNIAMDLTPGTYYFSLSDTDNNMTYFLRQNGNNIVSTKVNASFIINQKTHIDQILIQITSGLSWSNKTINIQLERGSQTTYEPYKNNTQLYVLDNPLRAIGNVKDKLYIQNDYMYIERNIGVLTLNGSESWNKHGSNNFYPSSNLLPDAVVPEQSTSPVQILCNYFKVDTYQNVWAGGVDLAITLANDNTNNPRISYDAIANANDFETWLSTHNTEVQYILTTPYTEQLGAVDMPSTYEGITHINTINANSPTMNISYMSGFEEIDEEYLKDVNVNFGEKFGAVNTIILSRGGDGDKITLSQPTDLADADKIAIQISENQIMNGNDRDTYMSDILHQLYGLEYYINDFSSTGICYLDLCDRYRINIGNNTYECIMFNDSVEITQGLKEDIYTDMQDENEQEYKYMSSTDRGITQANIIAKKNEATITEYTQKIDEANNRLNAVETKQTETDRTISIMSTNIDSQGNITEVTTTTGFTFNADGMTISDSGTNFYALHRNDGTYYYDGGLNESDIVGQYTKDGSKQKDLALFGVYYYGMDEITDTPMFVAELYHDENGEECFGHFYNRGD